MVLAESATELMFETFGELPDTGRTEKGSNAEDTRGSGRPLAAKRQFQYQALSDWPLSVIRCNFANDWRAKYEAGVNLSNGTEEQRAGARKFVEKVE